jgi:hypothetical protein
MKIQLERKLSSCPERLTCVVCHELFGTTRIRALLRDNHGLIQGDVCAACMKLETSNFQKALRNQANRLLHEAILDPARADLLQARAIEILETSEEQIQWPLFFHWILKKIEIFGEETLELEAARFGASSCQCNSASLPNRPRRHLNSHD